MRARLIFTVAFCLALPDAALADMGVPGFSRVPHEFIFEVEEEYSGYRFWLLSPLGAEPLDFAPGRPFEVTFRRLGTQPACIIAAPVGVVEEMGQAKITEAYWSGKLPPSVTRSQSICFQHSVPFFDSRERVVDRYRVEFEPGKEVRLAWLEQNAGSRWLKIAWAVAGLFIAVALAWVGWRVVRLARRYVTWE